MTCYSLAPHPDFPPLMVSGVEVEVRSDGTSIALAYSVTGGGRLVVPPSATSARSDGLWKTTCFELFLKPAGSAHYAEFNFAPSGQWAAYVFEDYRAGMRKLELAPPQIEWVRNALSATIHHFRQVAGTMALTAVIEEEGGRKSYWSLAHSPGAPDFHHEACFAATLPAPGRA